MLWCCCRGVFSRRPIPRPCPGLRAGRGDSSLCPLVWAFDLASLLVVSPLEPIMCCAPATDARWAARGTSPVAPSNGVKTSHACSGLSRMNNRRALARGGRRARPLCVPLLSSRARAND